MHTLQLCYSNILLLYFLPFILSYFNACKYNKAYKALYNRNIAKTKSKIIALIAVCNKLLKQAFSIVKNQLTMMQTTEAC